MKKSYKIVTKSLIGLFIFFVVIIIAAGIILKVVVTKDFVATQIENQINGRVEIRDISVPLWAAFSGITIEDFKIGYKDEEMKKPMDQREMMKNGVISFKSFNFALAIGRLVTSLGKDLELKSLLLKGPRANIVLYAKGGNNLLPLLIKPKVPGEDKKVEEEPKKKDTEIKTTPQEPSAAFSIKSIPTVIKMGKLGIEDGTFSVEVQAIKNTLSLSRVNFLLKDLLIDPQDLAHKNSVKMKFSVDVELKESKSKGVQSFFLSLDANGVIKPFDPATGQVTESAVLSASLNKGTTVTGLAIFDKLKSQTENLQKIGVTLDFLQDSQTLTQNAEMTVFYNKGVITLQQPPALVTPDFSFRLSKDDYLNVKTMDHHFRGDLQLAEKHTKSIEAEVDRALEKVISPILGALPVAVRNTAASKVTPTSMRAKILEPAMKDRKITLALDTSQKLTAPSVKVIRPVFPDMKTMVKNELGDATGNLKDMASEELNKQKKILENKANEMKAKAEAEAEKQKKEAVDQAKRKAEEKAKQEAAKRFKSPF